MGQLQSFRASLSRQRAQLSDLKSPTRAAMDSGVTLGGAFAAGAVDAYLPEGVGGIPASAAGGVAAVAGGIAIGSPSVVRFGTGMLAPAAYNLGQQFAGWAVGDDDDEAAAAK
jgi:hypothetical protein